MNDSFSGIGLSYDSAFSNYMPVDTTSSSGGGLFAGDTISYSSAPQVSSASAPLSLPVSTSLSSSPSFWDSFTSGFTQSNVNSVLNTANALTSLAGKAVSLYTAAGTPPAFTYSPTTGQKIPLSQSAGIVATPQGQSSFGFGGGGTASNFGSQIGSTFSGVLGSITPYLPWIIVAAVAVFAFKLVKKL